MVSTITEQLIAEGALILAGQSIELSIWSDLLLEAILVKLSVSHLSDQKRSRRTRLESRSLLDWYFDTLLLMSAL